MFKEFKEFAMRGNVLDMAVGIIIGAAFGKIVSSFVADVIMPPLGLVLGQVDFKHLSYEIKGVSIRYGLFINNVVDFVLVAFAIFLMIKAINKLKSQPPPAPANSKECPACCNAVPLRATRCGHCTSELKA